MQIQLLIEKGIITEQEFFTKLKLVQQEWVPCDIQYCYSHLLREVQDLEKEFTDQAEVKAFVSTVAPLLALAMALRGQSLPDAHFLEKASEVKTQIKAAMKAPAQHLGIVRIQDIFTAYEGRLYHWAENRDIPADNNLAERDLRPTVIARKVSFGSQSDAGAHTRSILMTVVHTLRKRGENIEARLTYVVDTHGHSPWHFLKQFKLRLT